VLGRGCRAGLLEHRCGGRRTAPNGCTGGFLCVGHTTPPRLAEDRNQARCPRRGQARQGPTDASVARGVWRAVTAGDRALGRVTRDRMQAGHSSRRRGGPWDRLNRPQPSSVNPTVLSQPRQHIRHESLPRGRGSLSLLAMLDTPTPHRRVCGAGGIALDGRPATPRPSRVRVGWGPRTCRAFRRPISRQARGMNVSHNQELKDRPT
jgi:hypothetical protein